MKLADLINHYKPKDQKFIKPYIIAEAGVNHEGSMDIAKKLIDLAVEGGADAIKFQTYKAETIASKDSPHYWDIKKESTRSQYELFKKYDNFWKSEFEKLKKHCDQAGIEFLSTPFDAESAAFLNDLMDVYKISSSDITNKPFIELICGFNKPIILSTGASYLHEIVEAVEWVENNNNPLCLMHCVLNYPTADENANLGMINGLQKKFPDNLIGYSDHTMPGNMKNLEMAYLLGAVILEKHFTHDKTLPGNDHYHAMDKDDLIAFRKLIENDLKVLGEKKVSALKEEEPARNNARRSLVLTRDMKAGKKISVDDLTWKRPAHGISPKFMEDVVGRQLLKDQKEDTVLKWNMLDL